jgi:signal transduction histidine kinase
MLERIQQLLEGLRQVTSDIAHDLRTPLGRLRQRLEDAREHATNTAEYAAATEAAIAEADSLLEIFSALLRIAQIEAGAQRSAFTVVDLSALMRSIAGACAPADSTGLERRSPTASASRRPSAARADGVEPGRECAHPYAGRLHGSARLAQRGQPDRDRGC